MIISRLSASAAFATLVALPFASAVHVIFGGTQPVVRTRLDPVVDPGVVSSLSNYVGSCTNTCSQTGRVPCTRRVWRERVLPQLRS